MHKTRIMKLSARLMLNALFMLTVAMMLTFATAGSDVAVADDDNDNEVLYWVAPMDPNYRRDKPGKSPMGMDLVPVYKDDGAERGIVSIDPRVVQNLGVRTAKAERSKLWRMIDTVGYIDFDESKVSHIHLRTEGWIENLEVESEGEQVKKGEHLFDVYSPELVNAQEEFVQALKGSNQALSSASRDRLSALGFSAEQISRLQRKRKVEQRVGIFAPQDGVVSTLPVREGMYVKPSTRVMSLADLSTVWLLAEVFERQSAWVQVGQQAEVTLSYLPAMTWQGKVEYIYPSLDPKTRTLKVRLRFDNPQGALKPNMYANVRIYGGATAADAVVIPLEAAIRTGRESRVIVSLDDGMDDGMDGGMADNRFEARSVSLGIESGDWIEVVDGIEEGEDIVVSGQFLIDSEASARSSMMRMSAPAQVLPASRQVTGSGILIENRSDEGVLNIEHEAIEQLGWPAMTMDFDLEHGVDVSGVQKGDRVMFIMQERDQRYRITSIHKHDDHKHDNHKPDGW